MPRPQHTLQRLQQPQGLPLPAPDADPLRDEPATRTEIALMCIAIAAVAVVLIFTIKSCAIA